MIEVTSPAALRSLIQEAGRQSEFFHRRGDEAVADMWTAIESWAFECKARGWVLVITQKGDLNSPLPIMPCGPSEQLPKVFKPKVL